MIVPILLSVVIVSLVSLIGIVTLSLKRELLSKVLMVLVALGAGTLLGGALFDLIPEAIEMGGDIAFQYIALGVILFFVIERAIHWHHHHHIVEHEGHEHEEKDHIKKPFAYLNLIGEGIHNFLDGTIIAASYLVSFELGIVSTIAIILHEIPQEMGDFGILIKGGFSVKKAISYNLLVALTAILGAVIVILTSGLIQGLELFLIAIAGGGFLYIALANLVPELHHEKSTGRQILQTVFLVIGVVLMLLVAMAFAESHSHGLSDEHEGEEHELQGSNPKEAVETVSFNKKGFDSINQAKLVYN